MCRQQLQKRDAAEPTWVPTAHLRLPLCRLITTCLQGYLSSATWLLAGDVGAAASPYAVPSQSPGGVGGGLFTTSLDSVLLMCFDLYIFPFDVRHSSLNEENPCLQF